MSNGCILGQAVDTDVVRALIYMMNNVTNSMQARLHACRSVMLHGFGLAVDVDYHPTALDMETVNRRWDSYLHTINNDPARFPHKCPRCGWPAYVGLTNVECSAGCG